MTLEHAIYGGPAVHKLERFNPTEIIIRLKTEAPKAPREKIEQRFIAELRDGCDPKNAEYFDNWVVPVVRYYFWHAWNGLQEKSRPKQKQKLTQEEVDKAKAKLDVGAWVLLNGKKLRDCTGIEAAGLLERGSKLAPELRKIGKRIIGDVLDEEQLAALYRKTY